MIVKIERDEIIDLIKSIALNELGKGSVTPDACLRLGLMAVESFFETTIDLRYDWEPK